MTPSEAQGAGDVPRGFWWSRVENVLYTDHDLITAYLPSSVSHFPRDTVELRPVPATGQAEKGGAARGPDSNQHLPYPGAPGRPSTDTLAVAAAHDQTQSTAPPTCPRCVELAAELAEVQRAFDVEVSRRTLGGTPLRVNEVEWANRKLPTPEPGAEGAV